MQFFLLFLFLATFIFLFTLYWMGKDDLILLRKNIALEQLFNITFIALALGLFCSRLFFVVFNPSTQYLNPLVFLVFPYYPGLSVFGLILSIGIFLVYLKYTKKIPLSRISDFYTLSFVTALPIGYIGQIFISPKQEHSILFVLSLLYIFLAAVIYLYVYPRLLANKINEGIITSSFFIIFPLVSLIGSFFVHKKGIILFMAGEEVGNMLLLICAISFLTYQYFTPKKTTTTGH